jgi:hypothetical protein
MKSTDELALEDIMLKPKCPNCGATQELDSDLYCRYKGAIVCDKCKCKFYVQFGWRAFIGDTIIEPPRILEMPDKVDPKLLEGLKVESIPEELYGVYEDAARCLGAGVPKGAAVLCRYVIQWALMVKGIPDRRPEEMINIAAAKNPPLLSKLADRQCKAATFMGGKGGHPQVNWVENITSDDAKQALLVTKRVLLELYQEEGR